MWLSFLLYEMDIATPIGYSKNQIGWCIKIFLFMQVNIIFAF